MTERVGTNFIIIREMAEGGKTEGEDVTPVLRPLDDSGRDGARPTLIPADLPGPASEAAGSVRRALLVEDDEALARLAVLFLKRVGFEATVCRDGVEAEATFTASPEAFDVVLTDVHMPRMGGIELGRRLLGIRPGVPVLLCTGGSDAEAEEAVRSAGFRGIVTKPFTLASLGAALEESVPKPDSVRGAK